MMPADLFEKLQAGDLIIVRDEEPVRLPTSARVDFGGVTRTQKQSKSRELMRSVIAARKAGKR